MDRRIDLALFEDDATPARSESGIRAVLEQSGRDIDERRTVAITPVVETTRATARQAREAREAEGGRATVRFRYPSLRQGIWMI